MSVGLVDEVVLIVGDEAFEGPYWWQAAGLPLLYSIILWRCSCQMYRRLMAIVWGDAATWVGSGITTAALLLTVITQRHQVEDRRRAQAADVSVSDDGSGLAKVSNHSKAPIYDLSVWFDHPDGRAAGQAEQGYAGLPAGDTAAFPLPAKYKQVEGLAPSVKFTDATGHRWHRTRRGTLHRIRSRGRPPDISYPNMRPSLEWARWWVRRLRHPLEDNHQREFQRPH